MEGRRLVLLIAHWSTVNTITRSSAAAPVEKRSDGEDGTSAERAKKYAMATQANATQGATTTIAPYSGGPCSFLLPKYQPKRGGDLG